MNNSNAVFNVQELPFSNEESINNTNIKSVNQKEKDYTAYPFYCSQCSDIEDFLKLTDAMVEEINNLRAEVVRWRQVLTKHLPPRWADGLQQDIFDNLYGTVFEDYEAYNKYVNRCCNGQDPLNNEERGNFMYRLSKGLDDTSITHL